MRATNLRALTRNGSGALPNRTVPASSASSKLRKRPPTQPKSAGALDPGPTSPGQKLAPFAVLEARAIDAQMWPVHSVVWLQPDLRPAPPASSRLRIERHYKIPAPDFLYFDVPASVHAHTLERVSDPIRPSLRQQLPQSHLVLLGWDPRAASSDATSVPMEGCSTTDRSVSPNMRLNGGQYRNGSDK
jgi:hypothetical protein